MSEFLAPLSFLSPSFAKFIKKFRKRNKKLLKTLFFKKIIKNNYLKLRLAGSTGMLLQLESQQLELTS